MAVIKSFPNWTKFYHEVEAFFRYDPQVHVVFDEPADVLCLYVDDELKAQALDMILPSSVTFDSITIDISVVATINTGRFLEHQNVYEVAFRGNTAFSFVKTVKGILPEDLIYVVFKKTVVQYFDGNLYDVYGQCSTLYQDIAKNIFVNTPNVYFCTDNSTIMGYVGEWP